MSPRRSAPDGTPAPTTPPPQPKPPAGPGRAADDEYLTVIEVAQMWHCDRETVYAAVYAGQLPWIDLRKPGGSRARIRIRRTAAHKYMADRERVVRAA